MEENKYIKLWDSQQKIIKILRYSIDKTKRANNLSDMGTGKTIVALKLLYDLWFVDKIDNAIIIIRKANLKNWTEEIEKYDNFKGKRIIAFDGKPKSMRDATTADILIVGYEMFLSRGDWFLSNDIITDRTFIICDEASKLGGTQIKKRSVKGVTHYDVGSKRAIFIKNIAKDINPYMLFMTGTLISNSPLDAFNMLDIYYHGMYTNFFAFREMYCIFSKPKGGIRFIVGYKNLDLLEKDIRKVSVRLELEDCVEMPELVHEKRYIELKPKHRKIYNAYKTLGYVEIDGKLISGDDVLIHLLRGIQLASDPALLAGEWHKTKYDVLLEDLKEIGNNKLIIACHFIETVNMLYNELTKIGYKATKMYGGTKDKGQAEQEFRDISQILIGHRQTIGYGLNLQFCHYLINYENWYDVEAHQQCLRRINRAGQKHKMFIIDYIAKDTVDEKVVDAIERGVNISKELVQKNISQRDFL